MKKSLGSPLSPTVPGPRLSAKTLTKEKAPDIIPKPKPTTLLEVGQQQTTKLMKGAMKEAKRRRYNKDKNLELRLQQSNCGLVEKFPVSIPKYEDNNPHGVLGNRDGKQGKRWAVCCEGTSKEGLNCHYDTTLLFPQ